LTEIYESADSLADDQKLCDMTGVEFKKFKEFKSIIAPLLCNLTKKSVEIINEKFDDISRHYDYLINVVEVFGSTEANLTTKQKSFLELYAYLMLAEGIFSETIQAIAFILVENHHDIYDSEKREFIRNYEGLYNLSLFQKMQFVEMHGFKFVSGACDRDLRNSIAHLRIIVNDDGSLVEITRKGKTGRAIKNMGKKFKYLAGVCTMVLISVRRLLRKTS
jgi:hypothetical protein